MLTIPFFKKSSYDLYANNYSAYNIYDSVFLQTHTFLRMQSLRTGHFENTIIVYLVGVVALNGGSYI